MLMLKNPVFVLTLSGLLLLLLGGNSPAEAQNELRRCASDVCGRYASSNQWVFCPFCGDELPPPKVLLPLEESMLLGNVYLHEKGGFTVERPSDAWDVIYGPEVRVINPEADLVLSLKDELFFMLMAEQAPVGWTIAEYADIVRPGLTEIKVVGRKSVRVAGMNGLQTRFIGKFEGMPMTWDQTVFGRGDHYFQINAWALEWNFNQDFEALIGQVVDSFTAPNVPPAEDAQDAEPQDPAESDPPQKTGAPPAPR